MSQCSDDSLIVWLVCLAREWACFAFGISCSAGEIALFGGDTTYYRREGEGGRDPTYTATPPGGLSSASSTSSSSSSSPHQQQQELLLLLSSTDTTDYSVHACDHCDSYVWHATACLATAALLFFGIATTLTMLKVVRSYSKKAERKSESSRAASQASASQGQIQQGSGGQGSQYYEEYHRGSGNGHVGNGFHHSQGNGQLMHQADNRHLAHAYQAHAGGGFSESSSYETREHFERKVQRVKKTRGERERSRSMRRDEVSILLLLFSWFLLLLPQSDLLVVI